MTAPAVGVIGLGLLGGALAERFGAAGFDVLGFDVEAGRGRALAGHGVRAVASAREVARGCARVVLSLPTSAVVATVVAEIDAELRPGLMLVDTTTGEPGATAALGARLAGRGVGYLDATVSGSSEQVRRGEAVLMVGGERADAEGCADLFACCARRWYAVGPWGSGARMKLVVNLVLGLNRAALAEALALARACGLDLAETLTILQDGASYSRVMDAKGRKMIEGNWAPEARLSQHLKDVRLILAEAARVGAEVPLSQVHRELLERAEAAGWGDADNSAVIRAWD
jgi:3-hydroxyisobutyrate dehydrogenase-like beta-hydroxyacid dehydrogenase